MTGRSAAPAPLAAPVRDLGAPPVVVERRFAALPAAVRERLARLEDRAEALYAQVQGTWDRLTQTRDEEGRAKRDIRHAEQSVTTEREIHDVTIDPRTGAAQTQTMRIGGEGTLPTMRARAERLTAERVRLEALHAELARPAADARRVFDACRSWIDAVRDPAAIVVVARPPIHVANPTGELAALGERLATLAAAEAETINAPVGVAEALARLEAQRQKSLERRAARRAGSIGAFFSPAGMSDVASFGLLDGFGRSPREIEEHIRDAADARFLAEIDEWRKAIRSHPVSGTPLSPAERRERLAAIGRERGDVVQRLVVVALTGGVDFPGELAGWPDVVLTTAIRHAT